MSVRENRIRVAYTLFVSIWLLNVFQRKKSGGGQRGGITNLNIVRSLIRGIAINVVLGDGK